ncbi:hypothetical protein SAMN05216474_0469 [Lishizhenia tianjinensis]|uniref:Uncharacterized protein n=1 Tax=Lishizhenia tianjinensis TaxID=477690 RepID=A0A1I6XVZ5_9FLAO|nr:hypothetical protein [Lishizhenia tianjinensis]SFT42142.1 hypothetical protein SAMN05216474_0469 [Lishizhenia tianjinensis]
MENFQIKIISLQTNPRFFFRMNVAFTKMLEKELNRSFKHKLSEYSIILSVQADLVDNVQIKESFLNRKTKEKTFVIVFPEKHIVEIDGLDWDVDKQFVFQHSNYLKTIPVEVYLELILIAIEMTELGEGVDIDGFNTVKENLGLIIGGSNDSFLLKSQEEDFLIFIKSKNGRDWLKTHDGKDWLKSKTGELLMNYIDPNRKPSI